MKTPMIIAGPCSAESESQVLGCAEALRGRIDYFRAGIWKPRTRPGTFEGPGREGLGWLRAAQELTGIPACTEVASPEHVKDCIDAGITCMWIGARTTTNPFLVQGIADSLPETVTLFVKNPVSPDVELWAGAVERFIRAGVKKVFPVHRGFFSSAAGRYRNEPCWAAALEMRRRFPSLPLICDPSHIAGDAALVGEVASRALEIGLDGLMVEVHPEPASALSDADQQLSPESFSALLDALPSRSQFSVDPAFNETLARLRERIDAIDGEILELLAARMAVSREIGECKRASSVSIHQPSRWTEVLEGLERKSEALGLDFGIVNKIFEEIHSASVSEQK